MEKTLDTAKSGVVTRVEGEGRAVTRLMEMGLTRGTNVKVLGCAPLGDPVMIALRGYSLVIRRKEARRVFVREGEKA